jgi:hypothetical protein
MQTFSVLWKCLPCLGFVGFGFYFLLTAFVPAWREKGWSHWKLYNGYQPRTSKSWLMQLGFAKPAKPIAEGDFDEKSGVLFYSAIGVLFLIIGIGGIVVIVYRTIT